MRAALVALVVMAASCGQLQQLPSQAATCAAGVVPAEGTALAQQAYASATSSPGAPTWAQFATSQLVSQGVALALCIVEAMAHDLDTKLPTNTLADASGHVVPLAKVATDGGVDGPSCADPKLLLAHDRAVDFLERHGVQHYHQPTAK